MFYVLILFSFCSVLISIANGWNEVHLSPSIPWRYGHSLFAYNDSLIVTHGYSHRMPNGDEFPQWRDDTWIIDLDKNNSSGRCSEFPRITEVPPARYGHASIEFGSLRIIYGGEDGLGGMRTSKSTSHRSLSPGKRNDIWVLDASQRSPSHQLKGWEPVHIHESSEQPPTASWHTCSLIRENNDLHLLLLRTEITGNSYLVVCFGGLHQHSDGQPGAKPSSASNSLWYMEFYFDSAAQKWMTIVETNMNIEGVPPPPRFGHGMTATWEGQMSNHASSIPHDDKAQFNWVAVIFGGVDPGCIALESEEIPKVDYIRTSIGSCLLGDIWLVTSTKNTSSSAPYSTVKWTRTPQVIKQTFRASKDRLAPRTHSTLSSFAFPHPMLSRSNQYEKLALLLAQKGLAVDDYGHRSQSVGNRVFDEQVSGSHDPPPKKHVDDIVWVVLVTGGAECLPTCATNNDVFALFFTVQRSVSPSEINQRSSSLYLGSFAGQDSTVVAHGDVVFHVNLARNFRIATTNTFPSRYRHSAVTSTLHSTSEEIGEQFDSSYVYLFGGETFSPSVYYQDLWTISLHEILSNVEQMLQRDMWTNLQTMGFNPIVAMSLIYLIILAMFALASYKLLRSRKLLPKAVIISFIIILLYSFSSTIIYNHLVM